MPKVPSIVGITICTRYSDGSFSAQELALEKLCPEQRTIASAPPYEAAPVVLEGNPVATLAGPSTATQQAAAMREAVRVWGASREGWNPVEQHTLRGVVLLNRHLRFTALSVEDTWAIGLVASDQILAMPSEEAARTAYERETTW